MGPDEIAHHPDGFIALKVDEFDSASDQRLLRSLEIDVFRHHDAGDLVEKYGPCAHVARGQRRIKGRATVIRGRQTARIPETIGLSVQDGVPLLNPTIAASSFHLSLDHQDASDRNPSLGQPEAGLLQRELHETSVVEEGCHGVEDIKFP